jgi:hypothetical protein
MGKSKVAIRVVHSLKLVDEFQCRSNVTTFHNAP